MAFGEKKFIAKKGGRYEVNPLGMAYSGENFYLVCYQDKYNEPASYRIDKMDEVRVEEQKIAKKKAFESFDLNAYKRETFGMYYGGESGCHDVFSVRTSGRCKGSLWSHETPKSGGWVHRSSHSSCQPYIFRMDHNV